MQHRIVRENECAVDEKTFNVQVPAEFRSPLVEFDGRLELHLAVWRKAVIGGKAKNSARTC